MPIEHDTYFSSYWFTLDKTGVPEVDKILELIATAGKAYHNVEFWNGGWSDDEDNYIELIQEAAYAAAKAIEEGRHEA